MWFRFFIVCSENRQKTFKSRFVYDGIQEVSGSIPLISTIEALKTIGFQGFLLFCGTFILLGTFLTRVLTRITKCPKNPICFKRLAVRF